MSPSRLSPALRELPVTKFRGQMAQWLEKVDEGECLVLTVGRRPVAVLTDYGEYDHLRYVAARQRQAVELAQAV